MAVDKLVDSTQLDADLTSVANAIRTKGGTSVQLAFPAGFVSAVQAIPTGTTPTGTKQISITQNGTTTEDVAAYANAEITVDVQGGGGDSAADIFLGDAPSGVVSFVATKNVPGYGISGRAALTKLTIDLSSGFILSGYSICNNPALDTIVLVNPATDPGTGPTRHGSYAITGNANLLCIVSRGCSWAYNTSGMRGNSKLQIVDFEFLTHPNNVATIASSMFLGNSKLSTVILRQNDVVLLSGVESFSNTPFASGKSGGTLYVPQALITDYQAATNWSTILGYANNQILPIEGSIYETQYADGTPIAA